MKTADHDRLMQAVLDGEATPGESAELERLLAADPVARARFEEWRVLFDGLSRMPHGFPPEGLVAAVMADLPREAPPRAGADQLFPPPGVIAASSKESRVTSRGTSTTVHAISQTGPFTRGAQMSEQQRTFSKTQGVDRGRGRRRGDRRRIAIRRLPAQGAGCDGHHRPRAAVSRRAADGRRRQARQSVGSAVGTGEFGGARCRGQRSGQQRDAQCVRRLSQRCRQRIGEEGGRCCVQQCGQ